MFESAVFSNLPPARGRGPSLWPIALVIIGFLLYLNHSNVEPEVQTLAIEPVQFVTNTVIRVEKPLETVEKTNESVEELKKLIKELQSNLTYDTLEIESEEQQSVQWLNSPVTQAWEFDTKKQVWITSLPYKESMRSSPSIVIGLREDGVVVWKKN